MKLAFVSCLTGSSSIRRLEADTTLLSSKLDTAIFLITQFLQFLPLSNQVASGENGSTSDSRPAINLEEWTQFAGKLVSSGETLVASKSGESQGVEESGEAQMEEVKEFFHERWDNQEDEYLKRLREQPYRSPLDHPDHKFIEFLRNRAYQAFEAKDYTAAKLSLQKILKRSPIIYGPHFEWRDETLKMLVEACVNLCDWEEADIHMRKQFKGRDETMEELAMELFLRGKKDEAAKICLGGEGKRFKEREAIMELLAKWYIGEKKWNDAKKVLSDLLFTEKPNEDIRQQRLHNLAEVYFALKEFENAKKCCSSVFEERKKRLGEGHVLYYQSVELLVRISEKQGDSHEAEFYKGLLATDSHSTHSLKQLADQKPAPRSNVCALSLLGKKGSHLQSLSVEL